MTQYRVNFSEYPAVTLPNASVDWTPRWITANQTWAIKAGKAGTPDGYTLEHTGTATSARVFCSYNPLDNLTGDFDILVRWKSTDTGSAIHPRIYACLSGAASDATTNSYQFYFDASVAPNKLKFYKYVANSVTTIQQVDYTTYTVNTWYWYRFRRRGTNFTGRMWKDGTVEPTDWLIDVPDTSHATGYFGVGVSNHIGIKDFDYFAAATGADVAPMPLVSLAPLVIASKSDFDPQGMDIKIAVQPIKSISNIIQPDLFIDRGEVDLAATLKAYSDLEWPILRLDMPTLRAEDIKAESNLIGPLLSVADITAPISWANPPAGTYLDSVTVTLSSNDPTATIRYTKDGTPPNLTSPIYTTPIEINTTTFLRWYARDPSANIESGHTAQYTITVVQPQAIAEANYIYCYDREEKLVCILDNNKQETCPFYAAQMREVMNGEFTLRFTIPYDHPDAQLIPEDGYVIVKDMNESYQLFCITRFEDEHHEAAERTIYCEQAQIELLDEVIESLTIPSTSTAVEGLTLILSGTRWQVGSVTDATQISTPFVIKNTDKLDALRLFRGRWRGDMTFRFEIFDKTFYRYIDFAQIKGVYTGRRFEYTQDIQEIMREIDTSQIKTALIGVGGTEEAPVDFGSIVWTSPPDPTNKPLGQRYLESTTARAKWGRLNASGQRSHLWGFYKNSEDTDPNELIQNTWEALQKNLEPLVKYSVKVIDLSRLLGTGAQILRIGDSVNIIDRDLDIRIEARILERTVDLNTRENSNVVLGQYSEYFSKTVGEQEDVVIPPFPNMDDYIKEGDPIYTQWLEGEIDALQNQINAGGGSVTITDDQGILIVDPNNTNKALKLSGGIFGIANTQTNGIYDWRTFGTGDGFTASEINAGTIRTNLIMILGDTNFFWNGTSLKAINPSIAAQFVAFGKLSATSYGFGFTSNGGATWNIYLDHTGLHSNTFHIDINGNATFSGTLAAGISITSPAISGGTITGGSITGGTITGSTTVNVGTDLRVGNNIYLNQGVTSATKVIGFDNGAVISVNPAGTMDISAQRIDLTDGYLNLGAPSGYGTTCFGVWDFAQATVNNLNVKARFS